MAYLVLGEAKAEKKIWAGHVQEVSYRWIEGQGVAFSLRGTFGSEEIGFFNGDWGNEAGDVHESPAAGMLLAAEILPLYLWRIAEALKIPDGSQISLVQADIVEAYTKA